MNSKNFIVLGITPSEKYAVLYKNGIDFSCGFVGEADLLEGTIAEIYTHDATAISLRGLPQNVVMSIFYMLKPLLLLVSEVPMLSNVYDEDDISGVSIVDVSYYSYDMSYQDYTSSAELNILNVSDKPTELVGKTIYFHDADHSYNYEDYEVGKMLRNSSGGFNWIPLTDENIRLYLGTNKSFSMENLKVFIEKYNVNAFHVGWPQDTPIPLFLKMGTDYVTFTDKCHNPLFVMEYDTNNPKKLVDCKLFDHVLCFRLGDGSALITTQPYLAECEIKPIVEGVKNDPTVPEVYKMVRVAVLGKCASWYAPGMTNLVVFHL